VTKTLFALVIILLLALDAKASEKTEISLPSGTDLIVTAFEGGSRTLIIWIHSERGASPEMAESATHIARAGLDLWAVDLHGTYMAAPGRSSLDGFDPGDIYQLMRAARERGYERIVLGAVNRGAILALRAGRKWQLEHPRDHSFRGYIFLHPHLIDGAVEIGEDAAYLPVARAVNKPVFILQPEFATKFLRRDQVARQLKRGGAVIKQVTMENVVAGFHARPRENLSEDDLAMRAEMGRLFSQAVDFLAAAVQPEKAAPLEGKKTVGTAAKPDARSLHPFVGDPVPPALTLADIDGRPYDLTAYKGRVVLVNFWATWCGPCIKEIPSLNNLVEKMRGKDFQLLSVDIKEPAGRVRSFLKRLKLEPGFPILMDRNGEVSKAWKVYAYPSTFLIDRTGTIRYAKSGALEWDDQEVIDTIASLF